MLELIQSIGVIQSVIIAACIGFMFGMLVVIIGERVNLPDFSKNSKWKMLALLPIEYKPGSYYPSTYREAIKELRRVRNIGLKDAKDIVDKWIASNAKK